ncbi:MAG: acetate kinase [Rhizobiales bacterium]|nr:acetate kinase [Rhizobacter sp.]
MQRQVAEQSARLEALRRAMAQEEASLAEVKRALGAEVLASQRARGVIADSTVAQASPPPDAGTPRPVGQAPESDGRAPVVAPIFEQPGVLTPRGKTVLDPSLQYSYSSSNRIALVGYTVIPAILIGVIDVREVKRNTVNATLTGRYGLTNRFEMEARLPYVYRSDTSIGREILQGAATDNAFNATGNGIGDVELTGRYQFNDGGLDTPYFVGSLRFKSRTGKDPFEVETSRNVLGLRDGVQTTLPTGSGFYGLQPALTMLFPSDPAVFFGTISYLHSFKRSSVTRMTDAGPEDLGSIQPGGVLGFNFGMGLGLNEKSSFSIGYDHASVGKTKQNGASAADSVRVQLGTLLLGYSYRLNSQRTLSVSLGAGLTRDTPDVSLTVRMPITF